MPYVKVVLGIPVEGPFDYALPPYLQQKDLVGKRAWVSFRNQKVLGYIIATAKTTKIANVKPLSELVDDLPLLNKEMLRLTKEVSQYYCCSWGEVLESALPAGLKKKKVVVKKTHSFKTSLKRSKIQVELIQDLTGNRRWEIYLREIAEALKNGKNIIFLSPEISTAIEARNLIYDQLKEEPVLLHSKQKGEEGLANWLKVKNNEARIVIGSRLAIFAPLNNLGLIILDQENNSAFKQEQTPHYHAREVALMRAKLNSAKIILGSTAPSLESIYLAKKDKNQQTLIKNEKFPEVKIIDMKREVYSKRKKIILTLPLQDAITQTLTAGQKAIIFLHKRGFATQAYCKSCQEVLRCPRCSFSLVYHFKGYRLTCPSCSYQIAPPDICPVCQASYIVYRGAGTEKVESELARFYPSARIIRDEESSQLNLAEIDILVSSLAIPKTFFPVNLIGVISLDNLLNRVDFRAGEKTYALLLSFIASGVKRILIQTYLPSHYCFRSLLANNPDLFYEKELTLRRQLALPPFCHIALIKLRGKNEERVSVQAKVLFERLQEINKDKAIGIISFFRSTPEKLRGNFYWQVLVKCKSVKKINLFLKKALKDFRASGIIVTVDVDPL